MADDADSKVDEAVQFMRLVAEAETTNRQEALQDLRFRFGDQWPVEASQSRDLQDRPKITINETDAYVRRIENEIRQQRPRAKAHPVDSGADPKIAEVVTGLLRHVDENSDGANAYDVAASYAVTMGFGYWRLRHDWVREDSFNQDIFVDPVENPFNVYFDPNSQLPDGSDAKKCLITDMMRKAEFEKQFPGAQMGGFTQRATGDSSPEWVTKDSIRLAEYIEIEQKAAELVMLSTGLVKYADEINTDILGASGITVTGSRKSYKRIVKWRKQSGIEILQTATLLGRWIPVIPVYGMRTVIEGKRKTFGAVRFARDPATMVNFWNTAITESLAMAPKAKWVVAEGQTEGHEREWARANQDPTPYITYRPVLGPDGQLAPGPSRMQPEPPPEGLIMAAMGASQNLQRVIGIFDPGVRAGAQRKSDKTINAEAQQTDISNFHFYDNLTRSLKHSARIEVDWTPKIWDTQRVQRIIGVDGRPKLITLNDKRQIAAEEGNAIMRVTNDVTVGTYDIVMDTGPGYNSRRQEAVAAMAQLLGTPLGEKIAQVGDDLIVRNMDFPGSDVLADRLAAANPLAQVDEESDVPPKAQMMIKQQGVVIQKLQQALQQAAIEHKFGMEKAKLQDEGATRRTLLTATTNAHIEEMENKAWKEDVTLRTDAQAHDTVIKSETAKEIEMIKGQFALILAKLSERGADAAAEETAERAI